MASVIYSGQINADNTFKPFPGGGMGVRYASYSWSGGAIAADTVIQMTDLFRGEKVMDVTVKASSLAGGNIDVIDVGFGSTVSGSTATTNANSNVLINDATAAASGTGASVKCPATYAPITMGSTELGGAEWSNVGKTPGPVATTLDLHIPSGATSAATSGTLEVWVTIA